MGIESFMSTSMATNEKGEKVQIFSIQVKESDMVRTHPELMSVGEQWISHCAMLKGYPAINAYINEQNKTDAKARATFEAAIRGEEYEPQTIYKVTETSQMELCRCNITITGQKAIYQYCEPGVSENGRATMDWKKKEFDLSDPKDRAELNELFEHMGPHAIMDAEKYKTTFDRKDAHEKDNKWYNEIKDKCSAYGNYHKRIASVQRASDKIDRGELFDIGLHDEKKEDGIVWQKCEVKIPNSDKVITALIDENHAWDINGHDVKIREGIEKELDSMSITPASKFTSVPAYMLKEQAAITLDEQGFGGLNIEEDLTPQESQMAKENGAREVRRDEPEYDAPESPDYNTDHEDIDSDGDIELGSFSDR